MRVYQKWIKSIPAISIFFFIFPYLIPDYDMAITNSILQQKSSIPLINLKLTYVSCTCNYIQVKIISCIMNQNLLIYGSCLHFVSAIL